MDNLLYQTILDNIMIPVVVALGALIVMIIKGYTDKISKSVLAKNYAEEVKLTFEANNKLMDEIATIVKSCVAANMEIANYMKEENLRKTGDYSLSDEQIISLQKKSHITVYAQLPGSLINEDSNMCKLIGGIDQLNVLIDTFIERYVYEYKLKQENCNI